VYEQMDREFHSLDEDLKSLNKNQEMLVDFIHEKLESAGSSTAPNSVRKVSKRVS